MIAETNYFPAQSWSLLLDFIKLELGAPLNFVEISDDEIVKIIKEQVLPVFSQYSPLNKWVLVSDKDQIDPVAGQPRYRYKVPVDKDDFIIDILEVISSSYSMLSSDYGLVPTSAASVQDFVIANSYIDALRSCCVKQAWTFDKPNILTMDISLADYSMTASRFIVVNYTTFHRSPETIQSDLYFLVFRKMALAYIMRVIAKMRSKYEGISTPFGQIPINWQTMLDESRQMTEECHMFLNTIPPDRLLIVE